MRFELAFRDLDHNDAEDELCQAPFGWLLSVAEFELKQLNEAETKEFTESSFGNAELHNLLIQDMSLVKDPA